MDLRPNTNLLHYRLIEQIGEGGMGVVWRALDTTLDRDVAIKFLPPALGDDPERLARFDREAKLLASLNHANIAGIFGAHEVDGARFLAMELVEGEDLSQRLERGPLAVEDALEIGRQIAAALETAHEAGVIHRDLKPANVKLTPEGQVKVLDFGLAKALSSEQSSDALDTFTSPTITSAHTIAGVILGTAAYMSPEQATGKPVNRRADIWAFGVLLHEMLTGRRLFSAETVSETLAGVLRDDIDIEPLPSGIPASVAPLLLRCLDRDQRTRLRDIGEARVMLSPEALSAAPATMATTQKRSSGLKPFIPYAIMALLAIVAMFVMSRTMRTPVTERPLLSLAVPIPVELTIEQGPIMQTGFIALAPDGSALAMALVHEGTRFLHVRRFERQGVVRMAGTEGALAPFFSPDGRWIGYFSIDNTLKKISIDGGTPITLCSNIGDPRGADWGDDDTIVFTPHYTEPLMRVPGSGGTPEAITTLDEAAGERTHRWPHLLPAHDVVLFTVGSGDSPEGYDNAHIDAVRLSTGERVTVFEGASMARYMPTGHLLIARAGLLFALPFDIETLRANGSPTPVLQNVMGAPGSGIIHAGFANNGLAAFVPGTPQVEERILVLRGRDGSREPLGVAPATYQGARVSPDGQRIAVLMVESQSSDLHIYDVEDNLLTRLTFGGPSGLATWSIDGKQVAFGSQRNNDALAVFVKAADGSGSEERMYTVESFGPRAGLVVPRQWSSDGQYLLVEFADDLRRNIAAFQQGNDTPLYLVNTPANEKDPALSPNDRWLAYSSDETGRDEVFVQAFPDPAGRWQVSTAGGERPRWSATGDELFFTQQKALYSVPVDVSAASFRNGRPELILDEFASEFEFDVFDENRLITIEPLGEINATEVTVLVNWLDELERLVPR